MSMLNNNNGGEVSIPQAVSTIAIESQAEILFNAEIPVSIPQAVSTIAMTELLHLGKNVLGLQFQYRKR